MTQFHFGAMQPNHLGYTGEDPCQIKIPFFFSDLIFVRNFWAESRLAVGHRYLNGHDMRRDCAQAWNWYSSVGQESVQDLLSHGRPSMGEPVILSDEVIRDWNEESSRKKVY